MTEAQISAKSDLVLERLKNLQRPAQESAIAASRPDGGKSVGLFPRDFGMDAWDWPQGVGLYGMLKLRDARGDRGVLDYCRAWYARHAAAGLPVRNVNTTIPLLPLSFLLDELDPSYAAVCGNWADWLVSGLPKTRDGGFQHTTTQDAAKGTVNLNEGQLWIDTLFMTVLFLARMARTTGSEAYRREAVRQYLVHVKYLFEKKTGLFYHGWSFPENGNFGGVFWCRGNSWYASSVVDFIEILGEDLDAGVRAFLTDTLKAQADALLPLQAPSGLWRTVLDDPESYEETSGSAGFAYGLLKAARLGLLGESYREPALKAVRAVMEKVGPDGTVAGVSAGTGMGAGRDHYRGIIIAPMAYGQSLALMALAEALLHV